MGISTLISTSTASNDSAVTISSGIDSTYDEYMFVLTDIGPATNNTDFTFQCNNTNNDGLGITMTTTYFQAGHSEGDTTFLQYQSGRDQAQAGGYQQLANNLGNGSDESSAGILHLFTPASTTYVHHFYSRFSSLYDDGSDNYILDTYVAGYFNNLYAIDEIDFKMDSGNFDGVIQMYGIA